MTKVQKPTVVLLIDDNSLIRALVIEILSDVGGLKVLTASDADKAFSILQVRPDVRLLIADLSIPGTMDGLGLAHAVSARRPDVSVILTSAAGTRTTVPRNATMLLKPYGAEKLFDLIRITLEMLAEPIARADNVAGFFASPALAQRRQDLAPECATEAEAIRAHIRAGVQRLLDRQMTIDEPGSLSPPQGLT